MTLSEEIKRLLYPATSWESERLPTLYEALSFHFHGYAYRDRVKEQQEENQKKITKYYTNFLGTNRRGKSGAIKRGKE